MDFTVVDAAAGLKRLEPVEAVLLVLANLSPEEANGFEGLSSPDEEGGVGSGKARFAAFLNFGTIILKGNC